ncbi:FAD-dependent oxidoreductase [Desulfofustis glycolicus]|uniref:Ion-translocating oxidoreductase complex subunit B n=1 Tax=Desulfofustis glycolicus DSM 9705 TaxID=1121409 RepID=A0A1M5XXH8_9BACT|nr:FAD-dependent oxidoreductase [Desulfofustis glycolicus]MCB2215468.1 FAD-dependent oxidoreductase [Desulfobulbaceae bacterium]SHI04525.1 NADPH-dependent glutamate synthase beta chain [Desulfofustis glycolicus DSM 9705]
MLESILVTFSIGAVSGVALSYASKLFYVYEDPLIAKVEGLLAGANCGGCGFAGCSAAAEAIVNDKAPANACILIDEENIREIAAITGAHAGPPEPPSSYNNCSGGKRATDRFIYSGIWSCTAAAALYGGNRDCAIGCLGFGDCIRACRFNAIKMGGHGFPVVDYDKCVGCGACEASCPKTILEVKTLSQRLFHLSSAGDPLAPCSQGCPAEIDIPRYIDHIRNMRYEEALDTIREKNPMPLSCGRVCPHPCESLCRRGIADEPVSINQLKRFVADYEMNSGRRLPIACSPATGKRIAIIGGGPAGISCAYFLRRAGHHPEIFEAMPKLGGMLRYGIPEYRLPKKILDWEIQGILKLGIESHTNVRLGLDFDFCSLVAAGFDAVFFSVGAWKDYNLGIPGEELSGCMTGINFLSRVGGSKPPAIGKRAAVIGGGNTAIDCCRTLIRMGLDKVYLVYRRTRKEMPANEAEIVAAEHEGIEFVFLAAPNKIIADEEKQVAGLEYLAMELGKPDASGRHRPVPIEGSEQILAVDTVITAIGQSPLLSFRGRGNRLDDLNISRWNTFEVEPSTCQTNVPYIFAAGDAATGPALVVDAIGGGRKAARSIDLFLRGEEVNPQEDALLNKPIGESIFPSVPGVRPMGRIGLDEIDVTNRIQTFAEVDLTISERDALAESNRCLSCCRLCYNVDTH